MSKDHSYSFPGFSGPFHMVYTQGTASLKDGCFMMGGPSWCSDSLPVHPVALRDFYISARPVTQALWEAAMGAGTNPAFYRGRMRAVERVSWYDAASFCNALSEKCNLEPYYYNDPAYQRPHGKTEGRYSRVNEGLIFQKNHSKGFRLPTEAQWEYAARGGKNGLSHRSPNLLGLYNMDGRTGEWCNDWYGRDYFEACKTQSIVEDPPGPAEGEFRVFRGGGWRPERQWWTGFNRYPFWQMGGYCYLTFRILYMG